MHNALPVEVNQPRAKINNHIAEDFFQHGVLAHVHFAQVQAFHILQNTVLTAADFAAVVKSDDVAMRSELGHYFATVTKQSRPIRTRVKRIVHHAQGEAAVVRVGDQPYRSQAALSNALQQAVVAKLSVFNKLDLCLLLFRADEGVRGRNPSGERELFQ